MQATDIYSHVMAPLFNEQEIISNSSVFQNLFTGGKTIYALSSEQIDINIIRGNKKTSKLKVRGVDAIATGPTQKTVLKERYTSIGRLFPLIEQDGYLTASQFNKALASETPFQPLSKKQRALALASDLHAEMIPLILRKKEVLASQAWREGVLDINEAGTQQLDFLRSTNLTSAAAAKWDLVASDGEADLAVACEALRVYGNVTADGILMNNDAFVGLYNQTKMQALANNRRLAFHSIGNSEGGKPSDLGQPGMMPAWGQKLVNGGAQWQGWIKVGAWTLQIFTYIDSWTTDAGVDTPFVPVDEVYVFASGARWDRYFGPGEMTADAIDEQVYREIFGIPKAASLSRSLSNVKSPGIYDARQFILGAEKNGTKGYRIITQAAPMYAPVQTDSIYTLTGIT